MRARKPVVDERKIQAMLRKMPVLATAPADVSWTLAKASRVLNCRARDVVYLPGDSAASMFFVETGRLKVSKVTRDGKELTLGYQTSGDFFGETCLIAGGPRSEMVEAMTDSMLLEIDRGPLDAALREKPGMAYHFSRSLIERRNALEATMEKIIFKDVAAKLADLLVRLSADHGVEHEAGMLLDLRITHQEMANMIGATRETVSLTLSQFKKKSLLRNEGRKLILTDRSRLRALV